MKAFGYCRVSSEAQALSGLSLEAQKAKIELYYQLRLKDTHEFGGVFMDAAVSAKIPFLCREGAGQMVAQMRPDDSIVSCKFDRMFRSLHDFCESMEYFQQLHYPLHIIDSPVDLTSAIGRMNAGMLALISQLERELISERTKEALAAKGKRGETFGGAPYPYRNYRMSNGKMKLVYDKHKREAGKKLLALRMEGYSFEDIAFMAEALNIKSRTGARLNRGTIHRWCEAEMAFRIKKKVEQSKGIQSDDPPDAADNQPVIFKNPNPWMLNGLRRQGLKQVDPGQKDGTVGGV